MIHLSFLFASLHIYPEGTHIPFQALPNITTLTHDKVSVVTNSLHYVPVRAIIYTTSPRVMLDDTPPPHVAKSRLMRIKDNGDRERFVSHAIFFLDIVIYKIHPQLRYV